MCSRIHQPSQQKQPSSLGQSNSSLIMHMLPLQHNRLMYFGLVRSHNQLRPFHTDKIIGYQSINYIHPRYQMMKAARSDQNGVLQSVRWSVCRLLSDVPSASRGSQYQLIGHNQSHQSLSMNISLQAKNCEASKCWRTVFGLATNVRRSFLKVCKALWRLCKVALRTSFTHIWSWATVDPSWPHLF